MNPEALLASSVDGLLLGIIFGLTAMGLTLIFGVMKVINLSHGPVIVLGMYVVLVLFQNFGLNPYLGLIAAMAFGLVLGVVIYFISLNKVINAPELTTLLATYGVNLIQARSRPPAPPTAAARACRPPPPAPGSGRHPARTSAAARRSNWTG